MNENKIYCNKTFDKNEIKELINWFLNNYGGIRTVKLLDKIKNLGFKYATLGGISLGVEDLTIPQTKKILFKNIERELQKNDLQFKTGNINILERIDKVTKSWNTTNELLKNEVIANLRQKDILNPVYMMTFSGARGNISQIKQLIGMRGLMSDSQGEIINLPIKNNLKEGLKIPEYFISCYGARKGLIDTAIKTANSGYLTRRLVYAAQSQIIKKANCKTKKYQLILNIKKGKQYYNSIKKKIVGRVLGRNIYDNQKHKLIASAGQDICNYLIKKLIDFKKIFIRSPLNCRLNTGICQLCYGWNLGNGRMVELGESIGIIAAQSIGEPGTQLTMRTFHTGGVFAGEVEETVLAPHNGILLYNPLTGGKEIETKYKEKAFFTLEEKKLIIVKDKINKSTIQLPLYSIIFSKNKEKVFYKQIIAQTSTWKEIKERKHIKNLEFTEIKEIKTASSGQIYFDKLSNNTKRITEKGRIYIISGNVINTYLLYKNLSQKFKKINEIKTCFHKKIENYKQIKTKMKIENNYGRLLNEKNLNLIKKFNKKQTPTIRHKEYSYTINKLIKEKKQLLINKNKTDKSINLNNNKITIKIGKFINENEKLSNNIISKYCFQITETNKNNLKVRKINPYNISAKCQINVRNNNLIKKYNTLFYTYYKKQKTEDIVQGLPKIEELLEAKRTSNFQVIKNSPHEKLKNIFNLFERNNKNKVAVRKSIEKIQKLLIGKIQNVYESQGVNISDKHLEIIIKQMTSKVIIQEQGDSNLMNGEIIEINKIEKINEKLLKKAKYEPIIIGISKLSLLSQSFISEASFQETTSVLTRSAIEGRIDWLFGLKENLVLGNLIPVGTGYKKTNID